MERSFIIQKYEKLFWDISKLKADRPHPRDFPHTPSDYRHTDKHLRLIMTLIQTGKLGQTDRQRHKRTDGRYQVHYLPASLKLRGR